MEEIIEEKELRVFHAHQYIPLKTKCALCGLFLMKHMQGHAIRKTGNTANLQWS
jgi:hypothetical protein